MHQKVTKGQCQTRSSIQIYIFAIHNHIICNNSQSFLLKERSDYPPGGIWSSVLIDVTEETSILPLLHQKTRKATMHTHKVWNTVIFFLFHQTFPFSILYLSEATSYICNSLCCFGLSTLSYHWYHPIVIKLHMY